MPGFNGCSSDNCWARNLSVLQELRSRLDFWAAGGGGHHGCVWIGNVRRRPTLVLRGDDDQIVPIAHSALLLSKLIKAYPGAPHGLMVTHNKADRRP
jgi:pimeloyl-ACP methyl ester carboxylesterase